MKFDFVIGNPPYQETKGGTKNVDVWQHFVYAANDIAENGCLIHPGRWLIPKKQMEKVHKEILESGLTRFELYPESDSLFPTLRGIDGGVTITLFKSGYNGDVRYSIEEGACGIYDDKNKFFSNKYEQIIYETIFHKFDKKQTMEKYIHGSVGCLGSKEFGYDKVANIEQLTKDPNILDKPIKIWAANGFGKSTRYGWYYIESENLKNVPDYIYKTRKVLLSKVGVPIVPQKKAVGFNGIPQIIDKFAIGENVFLIIPKDDTDYELQLIKSLFMTKTARFLMSLTQKDLYVRGFENIPDYTLLMPMLKGQIFTDKFFYENFSFPAELIEYIESHVSEKADKEMD